MKKICLLASLFTLVLCLHAFESLAKDYPFLSGVDKLTKDEAWERIEYEGDNPYRVFGLYNLNEKYDTPLKKDLFMSTKEYKDLYQQMKSEYKIKKAAIIKKTYYLRLYSAKRKKSAGILGEYETTSLDLDWTGEKHMKREPVDFDFTYDLKKGGFKLKLHPLDKEAATYCFWLDRPYALIDNPTIQFTVLPINFSRGSGTCYHQVPVCEQELLLSMSKDKALLLEENKESIEIYFIFKLDDVVKGPQRMDNMCNPQKPDVLYSAIVPRTVRIVMVNKNDGSIYYDRTYGNKKR